MQVFLAEHAGFCRGVKNALKLTMNEVAGGKEVNTFGPLVHNQDVADYLAKNKVGVKTNLDNLQGGTVVIRTHGITPQTLNSLHENKNIEVVDATCPYVKKVQNFVRYYAERNYDIIIFGDETHPEVQALLGWSGNRAFVIGSAEIEKTEEILKRNPLSSQLVLLSQTTQREEDFIKLARKIEAVYPKLEIINTICNATRLRQEKALELSLKTDLMLVIGDPRSSNTSKLTSVCAEKTKTFQISGANDIRDEWLSGVQNVGVTAGASTPEWTIKEVFVKMENGINGGFETKPEELLEAQPETEGLTEAPPETEPLAETQPEPEAVSVVLTEEPVPEVESGGAVQEEAGEETVQEEITVREEIQEDVKDYRMGDVVQGKIAQIEDDQILVDIGYKIDAFLPKGEVFLEEGGSLKDKYSVGDNIDLLILKINEEEDKVVVSVKRLERERRWKEMEDALENNKNMQGTVKEIVPAGIIVSLGSGIEGFMPGSLVDVRYIPDFQQFLGQEFTFKIVELNWERDKVILSRKHALNEEIEKTRKETIENLQINAIIAGTVKRLTDFGAFVDVGGIDGLVHISEISWQRVGHPRDILKVGDEIQVKILDVAPEKEKISLSIRQALPNPWSLVETNFAVNQIVKGKVTRIVTFGAFIELSPGVEGLVHISQLADFHVKHPSEVLQEGEEVEAKILEINMDNKRISLSIKEARPAPRDYSSQAAAKDNGSEGNVTLGDVFGSLFGKDNPS